MNKNIKKIFIEEKWILWHPTNNLSSRIYIDSISNKIDEFKIILSDNRYKKVAQITLDHSPHAYRNIDESFRLSTFCHLNKKSAWTFFKVENSKYISWLSKKSNKEPTIFALTHFAIVAVDSIVDIIDHCEPKVEFL